MANNQPLGVQYVYEVATSINLALALADFFFLLGPHHATSSLFHMDATISRHLGLLPDPKEARVLRDSFTVGYFAFLVPTIAIALCVWLLLRIFARSHFTAEILRSVAGIAALIAAPLFWLSYAYAFAGSYGWSPFAAIQSYEMVIVLVFGILYLSRKRPTPEWAVIIILILHYGFWFWQFGPHFFFGGYSGPIAPAAGLCAGFAWVFYLRQRKTGLSFS